MLLWCCLCALTAKSNCSAAHIAIVLRRAAIGGRAPSCGKHATVAQLTLRAAASVQELGELMQWLADLGLSSPAFARLRERLAAPQGVAMEQQPSVARATANFATLREELFMTDSQVRSEAIAGRRVCEAAGVRCRCQHGRACDSNAATAVRFAQRVTSCGN